MFVRAPNPIWYLPDLIGEPLNDEYYAFFLTNTLPYLPQNVYRDPQGMAVWTGNIVQFYPNGTLPNNLYFDPSLTYRIEIRHGNSQSDQLIYEINDFVPGDAGSPSNLFSLFSADNQITNPQFAYLNFTSPLTITTAGTYEIAPGWDLVLTGSGTTTVTQLILSGDQDITTNPPFALRISNNGWTETALRQRFEGNGALWAAGAVSMSTLVRANTSAETVTLVYAPNSPGVPQMVATALIGTGDYEVLSGAIDLPDSVNTTLSDEAYVDAIVQLPPSGSIDITNIQIIGQTNPLPTGFDPTTDIPTYQQQTNERELDHQFHVYSDSLIRQPKDNLLTGWTFGLNPWQFRSSASANVATNSYVADQTIVIQQAFVASAVGNNIAVGRATAANNYALEVAAVTANNQFGILQYIDPSTIRPYWSGNVSSLLKAKIASPTHSSTVRFKARLLYRSSLPSAVSQSEPVQSWTAGGDPVFAAGWTGVSPLNDPSYTLTDENLRFSFDKFILPESSNDNMTLGIFIYTIDNMNEAATADKIYIDSVSLVPNDFAIEASPETFDEALRKCQFYYEKSYDPGVLAGTVTGNSAISFGQIAIPSGGSTVLYPQAFSIVYKNIKRGTPALTVYSPTTGASGNVNGVSTSNNGASATSADYAISNYSSNVSGVMGAFFNPVSGAAAGASAGGTTAPQIAYMNFHYTADARLGI